jgi:2-amino-4-hydroxy-6-hydroxymethyldihydropteridine diphosphokinase
VGLVSVVVVGVGSNLGAREAAVWGARALLDAREEIEVEAVSAIYETEPLGPPQPRYLNAAFRLRTDLSPPELLHVLLRTERRLGRHRDPDERWGPRSADLDLLWDERGTFASPDLRVPHPELRNRSFALAPLLDVAPELGAELESSLLECGGRPPRWQREAMTRTSTSSTGFEVEVEADSLPDACALCVDHTAARGRAWSTRHLAIEPDPEHFVSALRDAFRTGFVPHRATLSHCSQTQWSAELHGVNMGMPVDADVGLVTTLGDHREIRARLKVVVTPP